MNEALQHIRTLTLEELAGVISNEDKELLYAEISEDETAKNEWEKIRNYFNDEKIAEAYNSINLDEALQAVKVRNVSAKNYSTEKKFFSTKILAGIAAVLAVAFVCGYLFFQDKKPNVSKVAFMSKKHITLHLANGKTIDLSDNVGTVQAGKHELNNTGKSLSFSNNDLGEDEMINSLEVPIGEDYKLQLQDGTVVWLNSETRLDFPFTFTGNTREISIYGEAYLQVAHNPQKPFIVHLANNTVKVLGTEFNVNNYDASEAEVSLIKGKVMMNADRDSVALSPGQQASSNGNKISVHSFDADDVLSWRNGVHYFYNSDVNSVGTIIQRWYGISVFIDKPSVGKELFTGSLDKHKPVNDFLENLKISNDIQYYYQDGQLHLR